MKKLKSSLALFLVLSMMLSVLPIGAMAVETTSGDDEIMLDESFTMPDQAALTGSAREVEATLTCPELETPAHLATKPIAGTTSAVGQPFPSGTGGSANFRIPGLVVLKDGTVVATADARWNYEKDGGGMDLVVCRTDDQGVNWYYNFAGYLGDNGNAWNADSTTLMDPVIMTDGEKLYLLADMYPAGYSISSSSTTNVFSETGTGFDGSDRLLLSGDGRSTYGYYLGAATLTTTAGEVDGYYIYSTAGSALDGYFVDGWFNLYDTAAGSCLTNLFFDNEYFQLYPTSYICMMTSTDSGETWSDPELLNVKPEGTSWMVLGPGQGVANGKTIAFTAYDGSNIYLHYSNDDGATWNTVKSSAAANESSIVELNDGTLRAFVKRGGSNTIAYVDFIKTDSGYTAGGLVDTGVANFSNCMVSSLHYSRTIDGKEAVLVCCPSDSSGGTWAGRFNGKIYVFTLDDSNTMTLAYSYQINDSFFAYSNMAEYADGSIGLLYEDSCISYAAGNYYGDCSHINYVDLDMSTIAPGAVIGSMVTVRDNATDVSVTGPDLAAVKVEKLEESYDEANGVASLVYSIALTDINGNPYTGAATVKLPYSSIFDTSKCFAGNVDGDAFEVSAPVDGYFTVTVPHFSDLEINGYDLLTETVTLIPGGTSTKTQNDLSEQLTEDDIVNGDSSIVGVSISSTSETTSAGTKLLRGAEATSITSGSKYVIASGNTTLTTNNTDYSSGTLVAEGAEMTATDVWTITAVSGGYTISQNINGRTYYLGYTYSTQNYGSTYYTYEFALTDTASVWTYSDGQFYQNLIYRDRNYGTDTYYDYYLTGAWSMSTTAASVDLYSVTEQTIAAGTTYDHTITFTGLKAGTTTVTIGDVQYNVTVQDLQIGDIEGYNAIVGTQTYYGGTNNGESVALTGKEITKLTIAEGSSFQLGVDIADYDSITWSSADSSIATVDSNGLVTGIKAGNTTVTATVIKGNIAEIKEIPVRVIPTQIPDGYTGTTDHSLTYVATELNTRAYVSIYSSAGYAQELLDVREGEVIFFERATSNTYGMIWLSAPDEGYALTFMAATNTQGDYYALHTGDYVLSTGSDYYCGSQAYRNMASPYKCDKDAIDAMLETAVAANGNYRCDGAMSQGRKIRTDSTTEPMVTSLTFVSQKLPETTKEITSVTKNGVTSAYNSATTKIELNDTINYTIRVYVPTVDSTYGTIDYTDITVTDPLTGGRWGTYDSISELSAKGTVTSFTYVNSAGETVTYNGSAAYYEFTTSLTLVVDNFLEVVENGKITNTVNNNYTYKAHYSSGSLSVSATAVAETTIVLPEFVLDFGLPMKIDLTNDPLVKGYYEIVEYSAKYGTIEMDDGNVSFTYVPDTVLLDDEVVSLKIATTESDSTAVGYGVRITPATSVYYEEGFGMTDQDGKALYSGSWSGTYEKGTGNQKAHRINLQNADGTTKAEYQLDSVNYGYDAKYVAEAEVTGPSNGTQAVSSAAGDTTEFTFTGTGLTIYANCTTGTGIMTVMLYNSAGKLVKLYQVDTKTGAGAYDGTAGQNVDSYSLPVISVLDLAHDKYTAKIVHTKRFSTDGAEGGTTMQPIKIDGFRVYNTMNNLKHNAYEPAEQNPTFVEVRNYVLTAMNVTTSHTNRYVVDDAIISQVYDEMYASGTTLERGVYYIGTEEGTSPAIVTNDAEKKDFLENGPKNELFLRPGECVAFPLATGVTAQIGMKAVNGKVTAGVTAGNFEGSYEITSSTDMFYGAVTGEVVIKNGSDTGILSVTMLKATTGNGNAVSSVFVPATRNFMLRAVALAAAPVPEVIKTYADAELEVTLARKNGREVKEMAEFTMTENGVEGETATFTAEEILTAVADELPKGYAVADEEEVEDVEVVYGEDGSVTILLEKAKAQKPEKNHGKGNRR